MTGQRFRSRCGTGYTGARCRCGCGVRSWPGLVPARSLANLLMGGALMCNLADAMSLPWQMKERFQLGFCCGTGEGRVRAPPPSVGVVVLRPREGLRELGWC